MDRAWCADANSWAGRLVPRPDRACARAGLEPKPAARFAEAASRVEAPHWAQLIIGDIPAQDLAVSEPFAHGLHNQESLEMVHQHALVQGARLPQGLELVFGNPSSL